MMLIIFFGTRLSLSEPCNYIFVPFWRSLWPSALGSRLVRLMVAPALLLFTLMNFPSSWAKHS